MKNWLRNRLRESSTWGGTGIVLAALNELLPMLLGTAPADEVDAALKAAQDGTIDPVTGLILVVAGALMFILKDRNDTT